MTNLGTSYDFTSHPLIKKEENKKNNLINGCEATTSGLPSSLVINGNGPSPTQDPLPSKMDCLHPSEERDIGSEDDAGAASMDVTGNENPIRADEVNWMQVSVFDNGPRPADRTRWTRYAANIYLNFEEHGAKTAWKCFFSNNGLNFKNKWPKDLTNYTLYQAASMIVSNKLADTSKTWRIRPTAGNILGSTNHVIEYGVCILFQEEGSEPQVIVFVDFFNEEIAIDHVGERDSNLVGNGFYRNPRNKLNATQEPTKKGRKSARESIAR